MKKTIALALMLALAGGFVHADENKADAKKSEKAKSNAKKKEQKQHAAAKSDQNVFQKSESSIGHWARKNKVWGTPRPGD